MRIRRIGRRDVVAAVLVALVSGAVFSSPQLLQGLSLDILTALRFELFGDRRDPADAPVVVVAIDEDTYRTPPFKGSPTLTWTREIGRVLSAIVNGGAKVVGFDVIFPSSIEQSEIPFGDDLLGARMKGFDRDFLRALATAARAGKLVLGQVQGQEQADRPSSGQRFAVRPDNIRMLNVYADPDDVVRRLPLMFVTGGKPVPSMAVELASRALGARPEFAATGAMTLSGYTVPSAVPNTMTLNFRGRGRDIPTLSFADLRACVEKGDSEFFRRAFAGKVVMLGSALNFEDRKLTTMRLAGAHDGAPAPRCDLPASTPAQAARSGIAGVFVHATAVRNLLERDGVTEFGFPMRSIISASFAAIIAIAACLLAPTGTALAYLAIMAAYVACAAALFVHAVALPVTEPALAGVAAGTIMVGYRFMIAEGQERFLRKSFGFYLAPQVIETMVAARQVPALGGEMRTVTVFFSDLAGFSSIAEKTSAGELVALMNAYLSEMTDIIERHGGYIDKYIGDSIVAVFGAPVDDPDHAANAVRAALECCRRLEELNRGHAAFRLHRLAHRIGLNSGEALVGNIGSHRRFNYTVMSDAVNVASRLEGANKFFGTSVMASETTVAKSGAAFAWRELDAIRVKGRNEAIRVYEPLGEAGAPTAEQATAVAAYAEGLACWQARQFGKAAECFAGVAVIDPPAALFEVRAKRLAEHPPSPDWTAVTTLEGK